MIGQGLVMLILVQIISASRAGAALCFIWTAFLPGHAVLSTSFYMYACISDIIDGYLARKAKVDSVLGAHLDLVCDKFLTIISALYAALAFMPIIPCSFIILREVLLLGFRSIYIKEGQLFPPQRLIGGVTAGAIWLTTLALHLLRSALIDLPIVVFYICYWVLGVCAVVNLLFKIWHSRSLLKSMM